MSHTLAPSLLPSSHVGMHSTVPIDLTITPTAAASVSNMPIPTPSLTQLFDMQRMLMNLPPVPTQQQPMQTIPPSISTPQVPWDVLLARYQQHATDQITYTSTMQRTSRSNPHLPTAPVVPLSSASQPKRTVLGAVTSAYLNDPLESDASDFDPVSGVGLGVGRPRGLGSLAVLKNASDFWRYADGYFVLPNARELDGLAKYAWPDGEGVEQEYEEMHGTTTNNLNDPHSTLLVASGSASTAARATRRSSGRQTLAESRRQRRAVLDAMREEEQHRVWREKIEETMKEAERRVRIGEASSFSNQLIPMSSPTPDSQSSDTTSLILSSSPSPEVASLTSHSTLNSHGLSRFLDSRSVLASIESGFSGMPFTRLCNPTQIVVLLKAIWYSMSEDERKMCESVVLSEEVIGMVEAKAELMYAALPSSIATAAIAARSPPRILPPATSPSPLPALMEAAASSSAAKVKEAPASGSNTRDREKVAPASGSNRDPTASNNDDDDDEPALLDVENLSLAEAEELLEQLEYSNQATACRLQDAATRYMIGAWNTRFPSVLQQLESIPSSSPHYNPQAISDLKETIAYSKQVLMNSRSSRLFTFSLTGSFSKRSNDRRKCDMCVTKDEKIVIDQWITYIQRQEYWKLSKIEQPEAPCYAKAGIGGGDEEGLGKGKGVAERVDSTYVREQKAKNGRVRQPPPHSNIHQKLGLTSGATMMTANDTQHLHAQSATQPLIDEDQEPDVVCCVCGDGDTEDDNQILFCDRCDIAVHQECYGIANVPEGDFFCSPCSLLIMRGYPKLSATAPQYACAVCWKKGGAMQRLLIEKQHYKKTLSLLNSVGDVKPPAQLTFAHLACAAYIGELYLGDTELMTPICGLVNVNPGRFKLKCVLCKIPGGACVQCCEKKCHTAYHIQCALEHGLQLDTIHDTSQDTGASYVSYCEKHRTVPKINTVLKAIAGQVVAGSVNSSATIPACQVCCYNVTPDSDIVALGCGDAMLCCTGCGLQVHHNCYGITKEERATILASRSGANGGVAYSGANGRQKMLIEEINEDEGERKENIREERDVQMVASDSVNTATSAASSTNASSSTAAPFLCRVCTHKQEQLIVSPAAVDNEPPSCQLCLTTQGALKRTIEGTWVCLPCTYFTPEVFFGDTLALEPVRGVPAAMRARGKHACTICDRRDGCPVPCAVTTCPEMFHVSCGFAQGWQFIANTSKTAKNVPFICYCGVHSEFATGEAAIKSNPQFANATFSIYTLPGETSALDSEKSEEEKSNGLSKKNRKNGGGSRKRKDDGASDDDSVINLDSDSDSETYVSRGTKSRTGTASSSSDQKQQLRMSGGVGQLTFQSRKRGPAHRVKRIVFLLDKIPCFIHLTSSQPGTVFVNSADTSSSSGTGKSGRKPKRKITKGAARSEQECVIKMAEGDEDEETKEKEEADGNARKKQKLDDGASNTASSVVSYPNPFTVGPTSVDSAGTSTTTSSAAVTGASSASAAPMDIDDDDEEIDPDEELFCVCRKPYNSVGATMYGCDGCGGWYHLLCLNITGEEADQVVAAESWTCPKCVAANQ